MENANNCERPVYRKLGCRQHISDIKLAARLETLVRNKRPYAPFGRSVHAGALKVCAEKSQFFTVLLIQNGFIVLVIQQLTYEHNLILL